MNLRSQFCLLNGYDAKKLGRQVQIRRDFDANKLDIMFKLLRLKFANAELAKMLIDTGDTILVEGNTWNDTFWGICNGVGQNNLGKLLMLVRRELIKQHNKLDNNADN
jgi:predicted NAD-dependent protein-ADP-ribosyltransferase YbiA (DUF1768 family)